MSPITTHILDTGAGKPAQGVETTLELLRDDGTWEEFARATTNSDRVLSSSRPRPAEPSR